MIVRRYRIPATDRGRQKRIKSATTVLRRADQKLVSRPLLSRPVEQRNCYKYQRQPPYGMVQGQPGVVLSLP